LNSNGNLILLSTASATAAIDGESEGDIVGNVTVQRYLSSGFGYKYFSSPVQNATVSEFGDDINLNTWFTGFYKYDETRVASGWVDYKATSNILIPLAGYAVNFGSDDMPNTVDITGIVNNGNVSVNIFNNNRNYTKGFNLIGNPYPSPIDWYASSGWTKTNIDDAIYYFKASDTDQYGGEYSTFIKGISSDGLSSNIIPSMQGFFVHVKDGNYPVAGKLQMNNNVRTINQPQSFIKGAGENDAKAEKSLLRFTANFSNSSVSDYAVVRFDPEATIDFNGQTDALKLMNTDFSTPNIYMVSPDNGVFGSRKTSIKALLYSADTTYNVPLGLKINQDGEVIIKIRTIQGSFNDMIKISLYDKELDIEQDLFKSQEYKIYLTKGEYLNRFFLRFTNKLIDPMFTQIEPLDQNSIAPVLPTTSINGIKGFWSPCIINTTTPGSTIYTFTPDFGQDAATVIMNIEVIAGIITDIETILEIDNNFSVYSTHSILKIKVNAKGYLRVYNMSGQILFVSKIENEGNYEFSPIIKDGIIIVNYISEKNVNLSRKIFFKN
jgi:hypothetical protein